MTDSSGPKISSWPSRDIGSTRSNTVGCEEVAVLQARAGRPLAAREQLRALVAADLDIARDLVHGRGVDERPDLRGGVAAGAEPERRRAVDQPLHQPVRDRLLDHDPAARRAALPGGPECRPQDALDRQLDVRIVQHHDGVLATQLERQPLQASSGGLRDRLAGGGAAGEAHDVARPGSPRWPCPRHRRTP